MRNLCALSIALTMLVSFWFGANEAQLSYDYYKVSCPNVEAIVWRELAGIFAGDATSPAAFLRLLFHDCQIQGCDTSILLDSSNDSEMISSKNYSIRKREAIDRVKSAVEAACPGQVSCADIIALAAKMAVFVSGGPHIVIPMGRRDSLACSYREADAHLPNSTLSVDGLLEVFMGKGMSLEESVAILGSHTLGVGHCKNIVSRLIKKDPKDTMEEGFEAYLRVKCRIDMGNLTFVFNDLTPLVFDNQYFMDILIGRGLFGVDASIGSDSRTSPIVKHFASDKSFFFEVFSSAFVKLSSYRVLARGKGEVRRKCSVAN